MTAVMTIHTDGEVRSIGHGRRLVERLDPPKSASKRERERYVWLRLNHPHAKATKVLRSLFEQIRRDR